jgi:hypothetical protein
MECDGMQVVHVAVAAAAAAGGDVNEAEENEHTILLLTLCHTG